MGQANRRRLMNVPVEGFAADAGQFACTLDLAGRKPASLCIAADKLASVFEFGGRKRCGA